MFKVFLVKVLVAFAVICYWMVGLIDDLKKESCSLIDSLTGLGIIVKESWTIAGFFIETVAEMPAISKPAVSADVCKILEVFANKTHVYLKLKYE